MKAEEFYEDLDKWFGMCSMDDGLSEPLDKTEFWEGLKERIEAYKDQALTQQREKIADALREELSFLSEEDNSFTNNRYATHRQYDNLSDGRIEEIIKEVTNTDND